MPTTITMIQRSLRKLKRQFLESGHTKLPALAVDLVDSFADLRESHPELFAYLLRDYAYALHGKVAPEAVSGAATKAIITAVMEGGIKLPRGEDGETIVAQARAALWHHVHADERERALAVSHDLGDFRTLNRNDT
jgi:hypothetical protein